MTRRPLAGRGCVLAAVVLGFGLALIALTLWRVGDEMAALRQRADGIAAGFQQAFHLTPRITSRSTTIISATQPVLELVTAKKSALVRDDWSQTWLGSTKVLEVEATFTAQAGFDLRQAFQVDLHPDGSATVTLPPARILETGMSDVHILRDEDGLWNQLTATDREDALHALELKARVEFAATSLITEARTELERRVRELFAPGARVEFLPAIATASPTPRP